MTDDPTNWLARHQAEEAKRHAQLPLLKDALIDRLAQARIAKVTVEYDGYGDEGQIGDIAANDLADQEVGLPEELQEQIEEFAWQVLAACHGGFENNEGGFGALTIDVAARTVLLDHNDRVIESVNTTTEV